MRQTGINMETVKKQNRCSILNLINQMGPISRKDIACTLGLTPAAVTQICAEFMTAGLLVETGTLVETNRAGRKKVLVDINYDHRYVFGINIEPEKTVIALTNLRGDAKVMRELYTGKEHEPEKFLQMVADDCREMQCEAGISKELVIGAGVGITGVVDRDNGKSIHAYGIWREEVPVGKLLSIFLELPVVVDNNVTAFALAETLYGFGKEKDNLMIVKWGPGVGSAIVTDKKIYCGRKGEAADLGHFIVEKYGKKCSCGRTGCLETKISYGAIAELLEGVFSYEETPKLYGLLGGDFRNFSRERFYEMLEDMDEKIEELLEEILDLFAKAIVNCMTILAPNRVILCGMIFRNELLCQSLIACCSFYDERYDESKIVHTMLADKEDYIGPIALFVGEYMYGIS